MKKIAIILGLIMGVLTMSACSKNENTEDPNTNPPVEDPVDDSVLYRHVFTTSDYMETVTMITVYHPESFDVDALDQGILDLLDDANLIFNAQTDLSELGKANAVASIAPVVLSDELYGVLEQAYEFAELSEGYYDPTIGPLADLWDIDGDSWSVGGIVPTEEEIEQALELVDYKQVKLDDDLQTVFFDKPGIKLDLGGIAKGYISELIWNYLLQAGIKHAIVNVGSSSQLTIGTRCTVSEKTDEGSTYQATEDPWRIGTSDPYDLLMYKPPVGVFGLQDKGLSSSGSAQQFFIQDGVRYHHIFDPYTGYPVDNELIVVQIMTDDLVGIDALSTMIYLFGLEKGLAYVEETDGLEAVFITYDRLVYVSSGFEDYDIKNNEYKYA